MAEAVASNRGAETIYCPHPAARRLTTVFVHNDSEAMGLCGLCLDTFKRLIRDQADQAAVRAAFERLGYTQEDADRFHADMQGMDPFDVHLQEDPT